MEMYDKNIKYNKNLQKTEKIQLYDGDSTVAMLTATYLYRPKMDEEFVVGIHIEDDESDYNLTEGGYILTLNGKKPKEVRVLESNSTKLKDISFVTDWGVYYLVSFPHTGSKKLNMIFESEVYGTRPLSFDKVSKYVFTKQTF